MPAENLCKGNNHLEDVDIKDAQNEVIGYRLFTGPAGEELADTSFCGDNLVEFYKADRPGLQKFRRGSCLVKNIPAWLLTWTPPSAEPVPNKYASSTGKRERKRRKVQDQAAQTPEPDPHQSSIEQSRSSHQSS